LAVEGDTALFHSTKLYPNTLPGPGVGLYSPT